MPDGLADGGRCLGPDGAAGSQGRQRRLAVFNGHVFEGGRWKGDILEVGADGNLSGGTDDGDPRWRLRHEGLARVGPNDRGLNTQGVLVVTDPDRRALRPEQIEGAGVLRGTDTARRRG